MTQVSHDGILHVMKEIQESVTGLLYMYWYTSTCKMMLNMDIEKNLIML